MNPKPVSLILAAISLLVLDSVYLFLNRNIFIQQIETIQKTKLKLNFGSIVLCYAFILIGLYYFIWKQNRSVYDAGILGLVVYGVYDTTTVALFKDWNVIMAGVDVFWGGLLFAVSTWVYNLSQSMAPLA